MSGLLESIQPGLEVYKGSDLMVGVSAMDQLALAVAVKNANDDFWKDRVDIFARRKRLEPLIDEVVERAKQNGDGKKELLAWENDVFRLFEQAGETEYAVPFIEEYLKSLQKRVNDHKERITENTKPSVHITYSWLDPPETLEFHDGWNVRREELDERISALQTALQSSLAPENGSSHASRDIRRVLAVWTMRLRDKLRPFGDPRAHWDKMERTVRVLQHLFDRAYPWHNEDGKMSHLFELGNLVERCNVWTPSQPGTSRSPSPWAPVDRNWV